MCCAGRRLVPRSPTLDPIAAAILFAGQSLEPGLSSQVRSRSQARLSQEGACILWRLSSAGSGEGVPCLPPHPISRRLGGLRQEALRRSSTRIALPGPVHASCRDLQSPARRSHGHPRDVPLERLRPWQQGTDDDLNSRGIPPPFPGTCPTAGPATHSVLRLSGESAPPCVTATLPNSIGGCTANRRAKRRSAGHLALPSLPRCYADCPVPNRRTDSLRGNLSGCSS